MLIIWQESDGGRVIGCTSISHTMNMQKLYIFLTTKIESISKYNGIEGALRPLSRFYRRISSAEEDRIYNHLQESYHYF